MTASDNNLGARISEGNSSINARVSDLGERVTDVSNHLNRMDLSMKSIGESVQEVNKTLTHMVASKRQPRAPPRAPKRKDEA